MFALCLAVSPAAAQSDLTEEQTASFTNAIKQAKQAFGDEDYDQAITLLRQANFIFVHPSVLYNIARSFEKKGSCGQAITYYKASLREGLDGDNAKSAKKAIAGADDCEDFDPFGSGRVVIMSEPSGAEVTIDGRSVGTTPLEVATLSTGVHKVQLKREGYKTLERELDLKEEEDAKLTETLKRGKDQPDPELLPDDPIEDPITPPEKTEPRALNIPAIALMGTGVLALGAGAFVDLSVIPSIDEEREAFSCAVTPNAPCTAAEIQKYEELSEKRQSRARIALGSYIGGGVLLAGGATWLILDRTVLKPDKPSALRITPALSRGEAGVVLFKRF